MADYDPAVVRAVLRESGIEVPRQGRLSKDHLETYERLMTAADWTVNGPPAEPGEAPGEYDAGISAADFPPDDDEAPQAPVAERKPRRVRQSRPSLTDRLRSTGPGRGGSKTKRRKHPRVPVDRLIGRLYEAMGRIFTPAMPPVGIAIQWQSDVAGLVLEDIVRDTVADRALQPLARAEQLGEKAFALSLPVIVGAVTAAQGLPEDQRMVRLAFLMPLLRECLAANIKIMGDKTDEIAARQAEMGPVNEAVDKAMAMIFASMMPAGQPEPAAA